MDSDMLPEYDFDYSKAASNRFVKSPSQTIPDEHVFIPPPKRPTLEQRLALHEAGKRLDEELARLGISEDEVLEDFKEWRRQRNRDAVRPEYPAELIKSGIRGKYAARYREGTNVVLIEPELHKLFPDAEAVNRALRQYAEEHHLAAT